MVTAIDTAVDVVIKALDTAGMLDNSVIVFASDNGGSAKAGASNWPLRGAKSTYWEGGMRVPSFVYSPLFGAGITGKVNDWYKSLKAFMLVYVSYTLRFLSHTACST